MHFRKSDDGTGKTFDGTGGSTTQKVSILNPNPKFAWCFILGSTAYCITLQAHQIDFEVPDLKISL